MSAEGAKNIPGFLKSPAEEALGHNAILAGFQSRRAWTDTLSAYQLVNPAHARSG